MGLLRILFGTSTKARAVRDQYRPRVVGKNLISPINRYGTCFACSGSGTFSGDCRACSGSGSHGGTCRGCQGSGLKEFQAKPCFACQSQGRVFGKVCQRCHGSGEFKPAAVVVCRKCSGSGRYSSTCRKCNGSGHFSATCKKCGGSGFHQF